MTKPTNPAEALMLAGIRVMSPWELLQHERRSIDREMANALSRLTGVSAQFWLNSQAAYDYAQAHGQGREENAG